MQEKLPKLSCVLVYKLWFSFPSFIQKQLVKKQISLLLCWHFSKPSRVSFVSVVFFFNARVNAFIPEPPYSFSIKHKQGGKSDFDDGYHLCIFLLSSRPRLSFVSVAFDFNDSLNDVAPVSPIQLPVDIKRTE